MARITHLKGNSETGAKYGPGGNIMGAAGSNNHLTGIAFGYVGQDLGKFMAKQLKKIKK